jgi:dTDP-4-amino-4,6-dideoxygalactose transaminase
VTPDLTAPVHQPVYQHSRLTAAAQMTAIQQIVSTGALGSADPQPEVTALERLTAERCGRTDAVAVASGTTGFQLALRTLDIHPGDEIIIPELGWISVGGAAWEAGATVTVAPVDDTLTARWADLAPLLTARTRAVVLTHMRGRPAVDAARIAAELRERSVALIEDCAQAWGVPGAGGLGDAAVFSTQTYKLIATGEGGVVCGDGPLVAAVRRLAGYAVPGGLTDGRPVWWLNHRIDRIAAALAMPQLAYLDELMADLRILQRAIADELATAPEADGVCTDQYGPSNGSVVGVWASTAEAARALGDRLRQAGFNVWSLTARDAHAADAWPVRPAHRRVDLHRYLDVAVPWVSAASRTSFIAALRQALHADREQSLGAHE